MEYDDLFVSEVPKRLSNKETVILFDRMKQGDMKAREELISGNIDLVIRCIRKNFMDTNYDKKELVSVGCVGLIKAVDNFDVLKHKFFSTHAGNYIHREIEYFINRLNKDSNILSFDDGFNGVMLNDNLSDDVSIEEMFEEKDYNNYMYGLLQQSMNCLNERSKKIIMLYFGFYDGKIYTQREIADMMNVSHTRIYEIMNDSLEHMKENIQRLELGNEPIRKRQLNIRTIYELLSDYTREEINEMIEELSDEDKELLRGRYGNDLDNPVSTINYEQRCKFYGSLVPRIRHLLEKISSNENIEKDYISNNSLFIKDVLFKELTKNEILTLLNRLRHGDMEAREELITKNIGLVIQCVKNNFMDVCYDKKELVAVGCLGLVKAVDTCDCTFDARYFLMHARKFINDEINMFLGELDTYQDEISFDDIIYSDRYGNNVKLKDVLLSEPGMEKEQVKKSYDNGQLKLLQQSMEYLNERNRRIINLYFGFVDDKRYSVFEIANIMAVSTTQIRKIIKDSLDKLKENIKLLENGMEVVKDNSCKKRLKTIYELLSDYTREEIDEMIDGLPEDDKELLRLRYGDDLDNPVSIMGYSKRLRYYTYLVNKMKRFLSNRDNTLKRSKIN